MNTEIILITPHDQKLVEQIAKDTGLTVQQVYTRCVIKGLAQELEQLALTKQLGLNRVTVNVDHVDHEVS